MDLSHIGFTNPILGILARDPLEEPPWLIPKLIPAGQLALLCGVSNIGKSYVSYEIAVALASGVSALSGLVPAGEPKRVVYFDDENSRVDRDKYISRVWEGLVHTHAKPPDPHTLDYHMKVASFELGHAQWFDRVRQFVEAFKPALMIFDTATVSFDLINENDNGTAMVAIRQVKELLRMVEPECSALVLKHANETKDGSLSMRQTQRRPLPDEVDRRQETRIRAQSRRDYRDPALMDRQGRQRARARSQAAEVQGA
jgi:RecA-family ATPase